MPRLSSPQAMTLESLHQFNGSPVRITLDGMPALAILFFLAVDSVQLTSLCFLEEPARCPLVRHKLSPAEIATLTPVSRNELNSAIAIQSAPGQPPAAAPQDQEMTAQNCMRAERQARRKITLPPAPRGRSKRPMKASSEARSSLSARQDASRKSQHARPSKKKQQRPSC